MKKIVSVFIVICFLGLGSQADMLRVEMGGGVWNNELSGSISSGNVPVITFDTDILNYDKESKGYIWVNIKHPVPILPNLRLEYANIDYSGTSTQSFTYKSQTYQASSTSDLTLDQFDIILYYNLLDNTAYTTIDLGLDAKIVQSEFYAKDSLSSTTISEKDTLVVPMVYGRLRFELPLNIGIEGILKYVKYKKSKAVDYIVKADYTLKDVLPVDVGFEVGYRFQEFDINKEDFNLDTAADIKIDGLFVGAVVRF